MITIRPRALKVLSDLATGRQETSYAALMSASIAAVPDLWTTQTIRWAWHLATGKLRESERNRDLIFAYYKAVRRDQTLAWAVQHAARGGDPVREAWENLRAGHRYWLMVMIDLPAGGIDFGRIPRHTCGLLCDDCDMFLRAELPELTMKMVREVAEREP